MINKKKICDMDCLNCIYGDCINEDGEITESEINDIEERNHSDKWSNMNNKQRNHYRYNHSEKRKIVMNKYFSTEKGKESKRRACQRYNEKKKLEKLMMKKEKQNEK